MCSGLLEFLRFVKSAYYVYLTLLFSSMRSQVPPPVHIIGAGKFYLGNAPNVSLSNAQLNTNLGIDIFVTYLHKYILVMGLNSVR